VAVAAVLLLLLVALADLVAVETLALTDLIIPVAVAAAGITRWPVQTERV
jgi:hypothetical protein